MPTNQNAPHPSADDDRALIAGWNQEVRARVQGGQSQREALRDTIIAKPALHQAWLGAYTREAHRRL